MAVDKKIRYVVMVPVDHPTFTHSFDTKMIEIDADEAPTIEEGWEVFKEVQLRKERFRIPVYVSRSLDNLDMKNMLAKLNSMLRRLAVYWNPCESERYDLVCEAAGDLSEEDIEHDVRLVKAFIDDSFPIMKLIEPAFIEKVLQAKYYANMECEKEE